MIVSSVSATAGAGPAAGRSARAGRRRRARRARRSRRRTDERPGQPGRDDLRHPRGAGRSCRGSLVTGKRSGAGRVTDGRTGAGLLTDGRAGAGRVTGGAGGTGCTASGAFSPTCADRGSTIAVIPATIGTRSPDRNLTPDYAVHRRRPHQRRSHRRREFNQPAPRLCTTREAEDAATAKGSPATRWRCHCCPTTRRSRPTTAPINPLGYVSAPPREAQTRPRSQGTVADLRRLPHRRVSTDATARRREPSCPSATSLHHRASRDEPRDQGESSTRRATSLHCRASRDVAARPRNVESAGLCLGTAA